MQELAIAPLINSIYKGLVGFQMPEDDPEKMTQTHLELQT
jgi:hypothetical protein